VRDAPGLQIMECTACGLVMLSSFEHITEGFYEDSGMHGAEKLSMEDWLADTAPDDKRRLESIKLKIAGKNILDFGCGAGGFLQMAAKEAEVAHGVELEKRVRDYWNGQIFIYSDLEEVESKYDVITAFHVIEHLPDPISVIKKLNQLLTDNGILIIEVPSSEDVLLTLYESEAFQKFTYWSQHLFLFNTKTMSDLILNAGLVDFEIDQVQRYPLSNHLYWLSKGAPGGHIKWDFLNDKSLMSLYSDALASQGKCDTIVAQIKATR
jgi:cyclopropane fatty-acyl-phospholipid synthase-like methyltransferase